MEKRKKERKKDRKETSRKNEGKEEGAFCSKDSEEPQKPTMNAASVQ
jgi:hypothetical protein